jgi:hypothetical protein
MRLASLAIVVLLVAAAVSGAALYYSSRGPKAAQTSAIPELVSLAPADSTHLLYADLAALRASPFLAHLMALAPSPKTDPEYAKFVLATGFDYASDLDRVVLAGRSQPDALVALAEGRFDREKISRYVLRNGTLERRNGAEVYAFPPSATSKAMAFAFLNDRRVALAQGPEAAAAVAAPASRTPNTFDGPLRERISRVADAAVFAVGQSGPAPENLSVGGLRPDQFANLVGSLRWFTLAARPEGDRLRVAAEGECDTVENARQLAATLDGLRVLGQIALADPKTRQRLEPATVELFDSLLRLLQVSRDDQRVRLSLELTSEMVGHSPGPAAGKAPAISRPPR